MYELRERGHAYSYGYSTPPNNTSESDGMQTATHIARWTYLMPTYNSDLFEAMGGPYALIRVEFEENGQAKASTLLRIETGVLDKFKIQGLWIADGETGDLVFERTTIN